MRIHGAPTAARFAPLITTLSCGGPPPPEDPDYGTITATDGDWPTGGALDDGADDGGPRAVEAFCLFDPIADLYGYRYQCDILVTVDFVVEHPFEGSPEIGAADLVFGPDADGDSYADPLVMGCCPLYQTSELYCVQPHEHACWVDLVEQGCHSMADKIEAYAWDTFPDAIDTAKRNAVLQIAKYVGEHQADCVGAFRDDTGLSSTPPSCDADGNSFDFGGLLEMGEWSFDPPGLVQNVSLSITAAEMYGIYPIDQPIPEICWSADENDGTLFREVDPPDGAVELRLVTGNASVDGPSIDGSAVLDTESALAMSEGALEELSLHSSQATVTASDLSIPLEGAHLRLWERADGVAEGSTLTIAPGAARFVAGVSALGESRYVDDLTNATPITVVQEPYGWLMPAFDVIVSDGEISAVVQIGDTQWQLDG